MHALLRYETAPEVENVLQAAGCILNASILQLAQAWAVMGNGQIVWDVAGRQLQLAQKGVDCPLQTWHVILFRHAAAVQQIVPVDCVVVAAVDVVHQAGDSGWAVAEVDTAGRGVTDSIEHAPATATCSLYYA